MTEISYKRKTWATVQRLSGATDPHGRELGRHSARAAVKSLYLIHKQVAETAWAWGGEWFETFKSTSRGIPL